MANRTPKPLRTIGALVRALLGLVLLAALLAGTPYALLLVGTQPTELPGGIDVLLRPDDGTLFFTVITCIGWAAWAAFTWTVILEIVAVARRRSAPRLRGLGGMQSLASFLVGGIVLFAPSAALAATSSPAVAVTAAPTDGDSNPSASPIKSAMADNHWPTHTVISSTELPWDLAEMYFGSGQRWQDIAALNPDIPHLASGDQYLPKGAVIKLPTDARPTAPAARASSPSTTPGAADATQVAPAEHHASTEVPTTATVVPQGTTLRVPEQAAVPTSTTEAPDTGVHTQLGSSPRAEDQMDGKQVVTVAPGDSLSKIAAEELHDGNQWPKLFQASHGTAQPDDLPKITDPDVIYPGQHVTVPRARSEQQYPDQKDNHDDESNRERPTPPATDDGDQDPGADTGNTHKPTPSQPPASGPQAPGTSEPSNRPTQQPGEGHGAESARPSRSPSASPVPPSAKPSPSGTQTAPATEKPATSPAGQPLQLRIVLGAGALLAAAITGALALRRLLQRRRRRPGQRIAIAPETSAAEAQLAAAAEPAGASRLDAALRTLAHHAAKDDDRQLPGLRAARIGARLLEVLPEDLAQEPQAPFVAGRGGWWTLPADAVLLDDDAAREVPAPYPGLVTIGSTEAGDLLLINLSQLPALLLDGDPEHITEVCTSLALEMGMSPWASAVEVVAVGFGEDLPQLLPTSRIAHMRQAAHALRDLTERLLEAHQMPQTSHQPYLLLCAAALDADLAWQFADIIDKASIPITLVAPASAAAAHFPQAEILNASLEEPQQLDYAGVEITVQRLEHAAYQQIATALAVSGLPATPAERPWKDVPDEPGSAQRPTPLTEEEPAPRGAVLDSAGVAASNTPDAGVTEAFGALVAAATDPAGLRLLPAHEPTGKAHDQTDATVSADAKQMQAPSPKEAVQPAGDEDAADEADAHDLHAPEIRVLGPIEVTGVASTGHGPRQAQLAALMYFRPRRSADVLCADMDPLAPWSASTLNARMQGLRRALGNDPAGNAYVPRRRTGDDPYQLSPTVRCDWTRFLQLAERALPQGPAGLPDLEHALGLVRGRPFGPRPLPWAEPHQQEMITRIIDVAHTVATSRTPPGPHHDLTAARQAIATGLDVDDSAELLYRDWMRIEHAAGNRSGLHTAITRIQQINHTLDCSLEIETEQLINDLLDGSASAARTAW
ncbi:hypothetical protein ABT009_41820 [Streptomyces sp. NPDC002896]|uniref:hypothetical protein n=1 Tax=Streptomyces sp. NPDC002896 TaxID=3154438 RepID=UPI00332060E1